MLRFALGDTPDEAPPLPLELPPVAGPDDPARPLVVIDAGHGGRDPGAIGTTPKESALRKRTSLSRLHSRCAMRC